MFNSISNRERVFFTKNLAAMLTSGIPVNEAMASLEEQASSPTFRRTLARVGCRLDVAHSGREDGSGGVTFDVCKAEYVHSEDVEVECTLDGRLGEL